MPRSSCKLGCAGKIGAFAIKGHPVLAVCWVHSGDREAPHGMPQCSRHPVRVFERGELVGTQIGRKALDQYPSAFCERQGRYPVSGEDAGRCNFQLPCLLTISHCGLFPASLWQCAATASRASATCALARQSQFRSCVGTSSPARVRAAISREIAQNSAVALDKFLARRTQSVQAIRD